MSYVHGTEGQVYPGQLAPYGVTGGGGAASQPASPPTAMATMLDRVQMVERQLGDQVNRLHLALERAYGPTPASVTSEKHKEPCGTVERIGGVIEGINAQIRALTEAIGRIEGMV